MWKFHNKCTEKIGDVMDIERLKKLNSLAGELKHQGIAHDHEDAAYLAVSMVGEEEEQCLSDMHLNENQSLMIQEIIKDKHIQKSEHHVEHNAEENQRVLPQQIIQQGMNKQEVEAVLQNFATTLVAEFNTLHAQLEQNNALLAKLLSQGAPAAVQNQEQVPVQRTLPQEPTQPAVSTANPRTGNFATEDVSIEKMFYFGSKK